MFLKLLDLNDSVKDCLLAGLGAQDVRPKATKFRIADLGIRKLENWGIS